MIEHRIITELISREGYQHHGKEIIMSWEKNPEIDDDKSLSNNDGMEVEKDGHFFLSMM